jgi:hypothetical protein
LMCTGEQWSQDVSENQDGLESHGPSDDGTGARCGTLTVDPVPTGRSQAFRYDQNFTVWPDAWRSTMDLSHVSPPTCTPIIAPVIPLPSRWYR